MSKPTKKQGTQTTQQGIRTAPFTGYIEKCGADDPASKEPAPPVQFRVDSVAEIKMQALLAVAEAQKALCQALGSTCTRVEISHNTFRFEPGAHTAPAISIDTTD